MTLGTFDDLGEGWVGGLESRSDNRACYISISGGLLSIGLKRM